MCSKKVSINLSVRAGSTDPELIYAVGYDKVTYIKVDVVAVLTDSVNPTAYWRK